MHTQKKLLTAKFMNNHEKTHHFFYETPSDSKTIGCDCKTIACDSKTIGCVFLSTPKKRNKLLSILVWMLTPKINRSHQIPIDDVIQNERSRSASTIHKLDYFYKIIIINIYYDWSRQAMVKWLKRACAVLLLKSITIVRSILEIA